MAQDRSNAGIARVQRRRRRRHTNVTGKTYTAENNALSITLDPEDVLLLEIQ